MPPNNAPAVHHVDQELTAKPPETETIFMGDLNAHLEDPQDEREDDLVTALANHDLEDACRHFTSSRR